MNRQNQALAAAIERGRDAGGPVLVDLFAGAGGAALGYGRAGFWTVGVELDERQASQHLGDEIVLGNVLDVDPEILSRADAVHASPPCQAFTVGTAVNGGPSDRHLNLIPETVELLDAAGLPSIVENVPPAREHMHPDRLLCGSMFGLQVQRHRIFQVDRVGLLYPEPPPCRHVWEYGRPISVAGHLDGPKLFAMRSVDPTLGRQLGAADAAHAAAVMGLPPGLDRRAVVESIPPAYTEWLGTEILLPAAGGVL